MRAQKVSGISLCLIRDPEEALHSYFIFAIRNGTTMTILTDREKIAHPAQNRMSRRPDRTLSQRASRNWFPYRLLDLKTDKEEKRIFANHRNQLVPINVNAVSLLGIRDLEAEEFVWATLMFDLIRDKFWHQDFRLPELSYTGEMIVEPQALVGSSGALVAEGLYRPLELPPLTNADVTAESTKDQWDSAPVGFNRWMVDRYGSQVPDVVLNPVGAEAKNLITAQAASTLPVEVDHWKKIVPLEFETMSAITFGTKAQIERDRVWVARMNQMVAIQRLAEEEYKQEKHTVLSWYRDHVQANLETLLCAAAKGELILPDWKAALMPRGERDDKSSTKRRNVLRQGIGKTLSKAFPYDDVWRVDVHFGKIDYQTDQHLCVERDLVASVFTVIWPSCPEALAILAGTSVEELPWPLRSWYKDEPYMGNHILDRLDPEDWKLFNPWMPGRHGGLNLAICISHSKQALHARRKQLGLPRKEYQETSSRD